MNELIIPGPLSAGDRIAFTAPGSPVSAIQLQTSLRSAESLGLKPEVYPSCFQRYNHPYLSASDEDRAAEIMNAFSDPEIKGIFCLRGGYGAARLMRLLDFDVIRRNAKFMLGSSDMTFLLNAVVLKSGVSVWHAPMPSAGYDKADSLTAASLNAAVLGSRAGIFRCRPLHKNSYLSGIGFFRSSGRLTGGNLTVLCSMLGTEYEPDFRNAILLIEDVNEPIYRIDRMLTSLLLSGKLSLCSCLAAGTFLNCCRNEDEEDILRQLICSTAEAAGIPAVTDLPFGHAFPSVSLPLGAAAEIEDSILSFPCAEQLL